MSWNWVIWGTVFTLLLLVQHPLSKQSEYQRTRGDDDLWILLCILTAGSFVWLFITRWITTHVSSHGAMMIGLFWPILFGIFQLLDFYHDRWETLQDVNNNRRPVVKSIREESATLISFIFAMGAILFAVGNREKTTPAIRLMLIALILCIGFIATTHWLGNHFQRSAVMWKSMQRVLVNYATGFLLCAQIVIFTAIQ